MIKKSKKISIPKTKKEVWYPEERKAWEPPEDLTVSECADKYRVLSYKSEKRGPWETNYNPVSRYYMDAFGYDCVQEIVLQKPTQSSGTEGILNMINYAILQDPGPANVVEPNENLADEVSQERMDDMIRNCDQLQIMLRPGKEETGKKKKTFTSMTIYFSWAGSPSSLAQRATRYCFFDEVNKYPTFSGKEASPLKLGKERTNTFKYTRKIVYVSTPTISTGYITVAEAGCVARFRYFIACPLCGHKQKFKREGIRYNENFDIKQIEETAFYGCEKCNGAIHEDRRMELVRHAECRDIISGLPFDECMEKIKPKSVGFQYNRLDTPWFSFGEVIAEYLNSKDDPSALMNFENSWMAEPYVEKAEKKSELQLLDKRISVPKLICPDDTLAVTAGIDPGQKGFWFLALAWLPGMVKHVLDYGFISLVGKNQDEQIREVREFIFSSRYYSFSGSVFFPIWRGGMDTGGGKDEADETMTERAYTIIRAASDGKRLLGTKGRSTSSIAKMNLTTIDKMPGKQGKPIPGGLNIWMLNTDALKDSLSYFMGLPNDSPGSISLNQDVENILIKHILAEEKQKNRKGEWEWVQVNRENHLLDCFIIALAMGDRECWGGIDILKRPQCLRNQNIAEESEIAKPKKITGRRVISKGIE